MNAWSEGKPGVMGLVAALPSSSFSLSSWSCELLVGVVGGVGYALVLDWSTTITEVALAARWPVGVVKKGDER